MIRSHIHPASEARAPLPPETRRWTVERRAPGWPERLDHLSDPPHRLWLAGTVPPSDTAVAVVGSRRATVAGVAVAHRVASELAAAGIQVVSGLARGIDAAAHRGALDAGGTTVAVLGSGTDVCYPPDNAALRDRILGSGCVVSEDPPNTPAAAWRFPRRNRIMAALTLAVVVVEAAERSGALITARMAADLGREVLAVPGSLLSDRSAGTNRLLRDGAAPWLDLDDLLRALPSLPPRSGGPSTPVGTDRERCPAATRPLDPDLIAVLDVLGTEPTHPDALAVALAQPASSVAVRLSTLEVLGYVHPLPGGLVTRLRGVPGAP